MGRAKRVILLVFVALIALSLVCIGSIAFLKWDAERIFLDNYNTNYAVWQNSGIDDYRLTVLLSNICVPTDPQSEYTEGTIVLTVQNNQLVETSVGYCLGASAANYTVEELFNDVTDYNCEFCSVAYDATYGYPRQMGFAGFGVGDSNWSITVTDFEILDVDETP